MQKRSKTNEGHLTYLDSFPVQFVSFGENHDGVLHHAIAEEVLDFLNDELLFVGESLTKSDGQKNGVRSRRQEKTGHGQTVLDTLDGHLWPRVEQARCVHYLWA